MLYMVEMNMPHQERLAEWHAWYDRHIAMLLALPGFISAQRFESLISSDSPYMAIYSVTDETALTNANYQAQAGPKSAAPWAPYMTNWHRNLVSGIDQAPEVTADGWLAVLDRLTPSAAPMPPGYQALCPVGLDRTIVERGFCVGPAGTAPPDHAMHEGWHFRVLRPLGSVTYATNGAKPVPAH